MNLLRNIKINFHRYLGEPKPKDNPKLNASADILHIGNRAYCKEVSQNGSKRIKKIFSTTNDGRAAFAAEKLANIRFKTYPWMSPWMKHGLNWYVRGLYPASLRLDEIAPSLSHDDRVNVGAKIIAVILDLHTAEFAHRDLNVGNIFIIDGEVKVVDFESIVAYPKRPLEIKDSYDITGRGLESPWLTHNMGLFADHPKAISRTLGIDFTSTFKELGRILAEEAREASLTFQKATGGKRHECRAKRIYSTFDLPGFVISKEIAQRNCDMRFKRFGIAPSTLLNKRVLDLGSNIGGMLLNAKKMGAGESIGVEFDISKVRIAQRIAAYAGVKDVAFSQGDIDKLTTSKLKGQFDVVFCLAINSHVGKPKRLFWLLGKLTKETVYFEGNSNTDLDEVEKKFRQHGFRTVERLGNCDDDALPENNCRPLLIARK